ncbi:PREDICTED: cyclin-dependent kinase inhibitor 7-like isoform X1 [Ipomoea nil]|uniref:cyclin-dependent kinase inhibitor 7-like isoform X1 n=1 Tax=Ipomoea nil TaxID=35883 RepID=UPI0009019F68|nr:PREDICTED: cyclin-dependent kinase inhibitor 7-like isoform X1 [Ipomoea nil]
MYISRRLYIYTYTYIHSSTPASMYDLQRRRMEEYLRRCERMGETAAEMMDQFSGGDGALRTTMAVEAVTSFRSRRSEKSVGSRDEEEEDGELDVNFSGNSVSPAVSATSVRAPSTSKSSGAARRKSREVANDIWRSLDLQEEDFVTDNSDYYFHCSFSRETTPSSDQHRGDTVEAEMESPAKPKKKSREVVMNRRGGKPAAGNKAPAAEIEEFFAVAEKYEQKRFQEKYNYDIVKDAPLEGRYQWVRLKP